MSMTKSLEENDLYSDLLSIIVSQESDKIPLSVTTAKKYKMSLIELNKALIGAIKSSRKNTSEMLALEFLSKLSLREERILFNDEGCVLLKKGNQKTIKSSSIKLMDRIGKFIDDEVKNGRVDIIKFTEINAMTLERVLDLSRVATEKPLPNQTKKETNHDDGRWIA